MEPSIFKEEIIIIRIEPTISVLYANFIIRSIINPDDFFLRITYLYHDLGPQIIDESNVLLSSIVVLYANLIIKSFINPVDISVKASGLT